MSGYALPFEDMSEMTFCRYSASLPQSYLKLTGVLSAVSSITGSPVSPFSGLGHLAANAFQYGSGIHSLSMSAGVESITAPSMIYSENNMSVFLSICRKITVKI